MYTLYALNSHRQANVSTRLYLPAITYRVYAAIDESEMDPNYKNMRQWIPAMPAFCQPPPFSALALAD